MPETCTAVKVTRIIPVDDVVIGDVSPRGREDQHAGRSERGYSR